MKAKNLILIIALYIRLNIVLFVVFVIGECLYQITPKTTEPPLLSYEFYKSEEYINQDPFILFSKYYYYEDLGEIKNDDYILVEDNVEIVKSNISTSLNMLSKLDNPIKVEFDYDNITPNDSYFMKVFKDENLLVLHYYDEDDNILYTTYFPK